LSIVGFDDAPVSRMAWPQLSTVRQPNPEMAAAAIDLLIGPGQQTRDGGACVELPYEFIERGSLATPARH
jgi:LacI family transcriptional regulator